MKDSMKAQFTRCGFPFTRSGTTWKTVASHGRNGCVIGTNGTIFGFDTKSLTAAANSISPNEELALSTQFGKHGLRSAEATNDLHAHPLLLQAFYLKLAEIYREITKAPEIVVNGYENLSRDIPSGLESPALAISFNRATIKVGAQKLEVDRGDIVFIKEDVPFSCEGKGHTIIVTRPDMILH
jgi:hypothetical protein